MGGWHTMHGLPLKIPDTPFHEVPRTLVGERMKSVARHDLSADHVRSLLLGVIVAACSSLEEDERWVTVEMVRTIRVQNA